jgi:hypothetical protein
MGKRCELYTDHKSLKMIELIKDYDIEINYHPGKANLVVDTLSQRSHLTQLVVDTCHLSYVRSFTCSTLGSLQIPKPWRWKWVRAYFKRFREANWKMRRSKR